jgi:hypothetical protein
MLVMVRQILRNLPKTRRKGCEGRGTRDQRREMNDAGDTGGAEGGYKSDWRQSGDRQGPG